MTSFDKKQSLFQRFSIRVVKIRGEAWVHIPQQSPPAPPYCESCASCRARRSERRPGANLPLATKGTQITKSILSLGHRLTQNPRD